MEPRARTTGRESPTMIYLVGSESYVAYLVAFRAQGVNGLRGAKRGGEKSASAAGGSGVFIGGSC